MSTWEVSFGKIAVVCVAATNAPAARTATHLARVVSHVDHGVVSRADYLTGSA